MKIVFLDSTCPAPYDDAVLAASALGGTEATVTRIATALSHDRDVVVLQHNRRDETCRTPRLRFAPLTGVSDHTATADHVVFVTKAQGIGDIARTTRARLWLWSHNFLVDEIPFHWADHLRHRLGIVCVSRFHADRTRRLLARHVANRLTLGHLARAGVVHHYNPVDAALAPDPRIARDPDKLVFFSSPHKGIEQVLARFAEAHALRPTLRLFVANPGYSRKAGPDGLRHPGVVHLGPLPQATVASHVREALCVFYPQTVRPETFGLVFAESNAVGTPVLAHDFGAAREVLAPGNPPLDARDHAAVQARLGEWIDDGIPSVGPDPRFALRTVADGWRRFFDDPAGYRRRLDD